MIIVTKMKYEHENRKIYMLAKITINDSEINVDIYIRDTVTETINFNHIEDVVKRLIELYKTENIVLIEKHFEGYRIQCGFYKIFKPPGLIICTVLPR